MAANELILPKVESWGRGITGDTKQGRDWTCPHCREFDIRAPSTGNKIVGFTTNPPPYSGTGTLRVGAVIVECPNCFETFWLHIDYLSVVMYSRYCEAWPKQKAEK